MALGNVEIDTITTDVWNNFYTTLKENVLSVSVPGIGTIEVQSYVNSNTEKKLDSKTNYPILVVNTPNFNFANLTYRDTEVTGRVEVEILANQAITADKFLNLMMKSIRDSESVLRGYGIEELQVDDTATAFYERGDIKVHSRKVVWRFIYIF